MFKAFWTLVSVTIILSLSLLIPLHLPGNPSNYKNEGTDIVFLYEIFGCGSLIRTIEEGGAAIYEKANLPKPESGVYEIQFTPDSDEPMDHIDSAEFFTGGVAGKYSYYMRVEVVGTERGAPECCDPKPAYNEVVPLVRVEKWEPASFSPDIFFTLRHYVTLLLLLPLLGIACVITLIASLFSRVKKMP